MSVATDIAIIGMSCRLPGASNLDEYWKNLIAGKESITFFSDEDLLASGLDPSLLSNPDFVKAAPALEDIGKFDARFFGYSPKEAALLDPQQRLFLEVCWETFENAGYCPDQIDVPVGIYSGAGSHITSYFAAHPAHPLLQGETAGLEHISNDKDFLGTRVSYKLNLTGPSLTVQTACSTSLVAVHLACQSLLNGECDMALAGASVIRIPHTNGYIAEKGGVQSRDGHCRSFDSSGTGTIFGSGVVSVVLKPVDNAIRDGDPIVAVIKGTCINNDGAEKVSYTAPSVTGQARAMAEAMALADVHPDTIDYVECHATGTIVGDPLEIQALTRAFRTRTEREQFCIVGSVKSNIGHPEQAAGLAGLIKTALSLKHRKIPPTVNLKTPNPNIPFDGSPFYVATSLLPWPESDTPARAAVNSLGIGGTNAFVVLEEAPVVSRSRTREPGLELFCLSAKNIHDLARRAEQFEGLLEAAEAPELSELCYTTNKSRTGHGSRLVKVAADKKELCEFLASVPADVRQLARSAGKRAPIVFLYTGQGAQHSGMGKELYQTRDSFRKAFDECDQLFTPLLDTSLSHLLFATNQELNDTRLAQPALFAYEYAMTRLWESIGIKADAVIGHSLGEIAAACIAGVCSLADAVKLVNQRSLFMQRAPVGGTMVAVSAANDEVLAVIKASEAAVEVASINSDFSTVISGENSEVGKVLKLMSSKEMRTTKLKVSHAFHSAMMEPILDDFEEAISAIDFQSASIPFISNTSGDFFSGPFDAAYWRHHIRNPVHYSRGVTSLLEAGYGVFIEVGPGQGMITMGQQNVKAQKTSWIPSTVLGTSEELGFLNAVAEVYISGHKLDWRAISRQSLTSDKFLPTYPFNRQRYWLEPDSTDGLAKTATYKLDEILGKPVQTGSNSLEFVFDYGVQSFPELGDHRILGQVILPTTIAIELARRAGAQRFGRDIKSVLDLAYHEAMVLPETRDMQIKLTLTSRSSSSADFEILSYRSNERWQRKLSGRLSTEAPETAKEVIARDWDLPSKDGFKIIEHTEIYQELRHWGLEYGPSFSLASSVRASQDTALIELDNSGSNPRMSSILLDAALHTYPLLLKDNSGLWLPVGLQRIGYSGELAAARRAIVEVKENSEAQLIIDIRAFDAEMKMLVSIEALEIRQLSKEALKEPSSQIFESWLYDAQWITAELPEESFATETWFVDGYDEATTKYLQKVLVDSGQQVLFDESKGESDHVVFVSDLSGLSPEASVGAVNAKLEATLKPAVELVKRLSANPQYRPRLWFISKGAQRVSDETVNPIAATIWGFAQSIMWEYPQLKATCVDLDPAVDYEECIAGLCLEKLSKLEGEDQFSRRGNELYLRRFKQLNRKPLPAAEKLKIEVNASYLITGGVGSLGLHISRCLVEEHGVKSLVLTARSAPTGEAKKSIKRIEQMGCSVKVVKADIAIEADVARVFAELQGLPELRGVIHSAGVLADGVIATLTWDDFCRSFAAKVSGTWLLHQHTRDADLDFFVLQSSILSLIGAAGQSNYTAANAFMDCFCHFRLSSGLPATTMNWGPWSETGMATSSGDRGAQIWEARGLEYIDPREGARISTHLIENNISHAAISCIDWQKYFAVTHVERNYFADFMQKRRSEFKLEIEDFQEQLKTASKEDKFDLILSVLQQEISTELGFEELIDPTQPLNELGLDSLMAISLTNRLENRLNLTVPVVEMIQGPSLSQLSSYLLSTILGESTAANGDETLFEEFSGGAGSASNGGRSASTPYRDGWLVFPKPNPDAVVRLFCFNYAGGGATIYRPWTKYIGDHIELVAIEPPGRGSRTKEPVVDELEQFKSEVMESIEKYLDKPCALFGHCLGGLNVYEAARALSEKNPGLLNHVFVSASRPPHEVAAISAFEEALFEDLLEMPKYKPFLNIHEQPDGILFKIIREFDIAASEDFLNHQQLRKILIPAIRADFKMAGQYKPENQLALATPITCFQGIRDNYVTSEQAAGWSRYTGNEFRLLYRDAAHFIIVDEREFIIDTINKTLRH